jgi:starch synthase
VDVPAFFERGRLYGESDDRLRFAALSRAAIDELRRRGERPSVFHTHDWQTGLLPVYLKAFFAADPVVGRVACLHTIHNVAYQGRFGLDTLPLLGLPWSLGTPEALEFHGGVSYLKAGVMFSELVNTVSPTYAREIQGPEHGFGFESVLRARGDDLVGVLNGVDYEEWDPRHDPHIDCRYTPEDPAGKAACKRALLRTFGLPADPELPVVGVVSRLVWQKGFDFVAAAWHDLLQRPLRLVVLGTGDREIQDGLRHLQDRDPSRFAVRFHYDEALAHQVIAGSDLFLMPSRSEPCGLTQMYALRYGTPPIVRSTGGLADTVDPWDAETRTGTGFRFDHADGTGLLWALDQALAALRDPEGALVLRRNGMTRDFSWYRSAGDYVDLYRRAMARA